MRFECNIKEVVDMLPISDIINDYNSAKNETIDIIYQPDESC